jgi:hypothetical protein
MFHLVICLAYCSIFTAISCLLDLLERTNQQIITRTDLLNSWTVVSDWENVVHTRFVLTGKKYIFSAVTVFL